MDQRTSRGVAQAVARAIYGMGVFLLVAVVWAYFANRSDPSRDETSTYVTMLVIGVVMTVVGRLLQARLA